MTTIYRILSLLINIMAIMLGISLVFSLSTLITAPFMLLPTFILAAIILYAWFSYKFRIEVLLQQKTVNRSLRDWVRVNGIVSLVFSALVAIDVALILQNPASFYEAAKNFGLTLPPGDLTPLFAGMLVYALLLAAHVLCTFRLMRQYKDFFN